MCPLRQASLSPRDGRPKVLQPPEEPPKICRQTAITIAPGTGARYRQDLPYGSPAWQARYATLRNTIEGLNGYAKDPAHQALGQPARRRVRGIAACSLFTALLLMAANIRKIRAWRALTTGGKAATAQRARRRRDQPPRLPPRRLTARKHPSPHRLPSPARQQPRPGPARTAQPGPPARPVKRCPAANPNVRPAGTLRSGHQHSSVGTTPAVLSVTLGALGGTRTPNLLIRSKIRLVQIRLSLSIRAAGTLRGDLAVPASSVLVQIRC